VRSLSLTETEEFYDKNQTSVSSLTDDAASEVLRLNNLKRLFDSCTSLIVKGLENCSRLQQKIVESKAKKEKKT
jgi:hypothetical protein